MTRVETNDHAEPTSPWRPDAQARSIASAAGPSESPEVDPSQDPKLDSKLEQGRAQTAAPIGGASQSHPAATRADARPKARLTRPDLN
jgi:hypothetical protein